MVGQGWQEEKSREIQLRTNKFFYYYAFSSSKLAREVTGSFYHPPRLFVPSSPQGLSLRCNLLSTFPVTPFLIQSLLPPVHGAFPSDRLWPSGWHSVHQERSRRVSAVRVESLGLLWGQNSLCWNLSLFNCEIDVTKLWLPFLVPQSHVRHLRGLERKAVWGIPGAGGVLAPTACKGGPANVGVLHAGGSRWQPQVSHGVAFPAQNSSNALHQGLLKNVFQRAAASQLPARHRLCLQAEAVF